MRPRAGRSRRNGARFFNQQSSVRNLQFRMSFRDCVVWITGASSGIGEALVKPLVARGARVAISARRGDLLEERARAWRQSGADVRAFPLDVLDKEANRLVVQQVIDAFGGIDMAVLNAGNHVTPKARPFDAQQYVDNMSLNFFGMLYGIEAVLPGMLARGRGHIAGISSLAGVRPLPAAGAYGASKAAASHMLDAIRFDLAPRGILVTNVTPGFVRTPLTNRNKYRMPFLMEVDRAAEILADGLERGKREIHFPKPLSWTIKTLRVLPYPLYAWIIQRATGDRQRLAKSDS
jgi:NAD(P)-dependent dehydrogenase (short-subunit alcohol dehydrogenase family)